LLVTSTIMRLKFANNAFLNFGLMNDLLATSAIMRSKLFKFAKSSTLYKLESIFDSHTTKWNVICKLRDDKKHYMGDYRTFISFSGLKVNGFISNEWPINITNSVHIVKFLDFNSLQIIKNVFICERVEDIWISNQFFQITLHNTKFSCFNFYKKPLLTQSSSLMPKRFNTHLQFQYFINKNSLDSLKV